MNFRRTKIIATIGPSSISEKTITQLIRSGVNVFRLNFSHGDKNTHKESIRKIRKISQSLNIPCGILQDLQGPKIRVSKFKNKSEILKKGKKFIITARNIEGDSTKVGTTYKKLAKDLKRGDNIYINDGLIKLKVIDIKGLDIITKIIIGGKISNNKGINLPNSKISEPSLTKKDIDDLQFGIENDVDFAALSFVRSPKDIKKLDSIIKKSGKSIQIISKIEKPEAVENIEEIIKLSDGVMIARGDLGVEINPEKVPAIQKEIIKLAREYNKYSITATQMLESMRENTFPTRAEASDVANSVYDGTDAVMLSAETAAGKYPVLSVKMMDRIVRETECTTIKNEQGFFVNKKDDSYILALSQAAIMACEEIKGNNIIAFTQSGSTARMVSKFKRKENIIALTPDKKVLHQLSIIWGVIPVYFPYAKSTDDMVKNGLKEVIKRKLIKKNENVVILSGNAMHRGGTNMLKIEKV